MTYFVNVEQRFSLFLKSFISMVKLPFFEITIFCRWDKGPREVWITRGQGWRGLWGRCRGQPETGSVWASGVGEATRRPPHWCWRQHWLGIDKQNCFGILPVDFLILIPSSVTRLGDLLDFWQVFKAFGNNQFAQISHILRQFLLGCQNLSFF